MPELVVYEATRQIRQLNKNMIIIAPTAFGLTGHREKALNAGCNDDLPQPLNNKKLLNIIYSNF